MTNRLDVGTVVAMRGGATLVFRFIRPSDKAALREGFKHLSPETRYRRFHAPMPTLSAPMLRYLTEVDGWNHFAIVAVAPMTRERRTRVVGVARAVRLAEDHRVAEIALVVADDLQRRGVGTLLVDLLVRAARARGIATLVAQTHYDDRTVRELLVAHGPVIDRIDGGARTVEVSITAARVHDPFALHS